MHEINKFKNINIFLNRTKPFVEKGRNQTEEESDEFAKEMLRIVKENTELHFQMDCIASVTALRILEKLPI